MAPSDVEGPDPRYFLSMPAWFYILRLQLGALYVGATTKLAQRYADHCAGHACRTTRRDPPEALVYTEELPAFSDARRREAQIKRWSRAKKEALVASDRSALRGLARSHDHGT
jgi:putative endonuclease